MAQSITFLLNDDPVELSDISPNLTVLNYLRDHLSLKGTKEGCAEGDCGACTVVVGELINGELSYKAVNSCVLFVVTLDGKQLLTVEHLREKGELNRVQQLFVDKHASQCGYCTPGFVMSAYGHQLSLQHSEAYADQYRDLSSESVTQKMNQLFAGNLCRCTGYGPIIDAGIAVTEETLSEEIKQAKEYRAKITQALQSLQPHSLKLNFEEMNYWKPTSSDELALILATNPETKILAGGTDLGLWVSKLGKEIPQLVYLGAIPELKKIEETDTELRFYAGVTYTEAMDKLIAFAPEFSEYLYRHSSTQIRNSGTLVGNIANGSPIGDMPPPFLALGARLQLKSVERTRELLLEDYFIDYGKQAILPGEFIEKVSLPKLSSADFFRIYKISKRFEQDISAVSFAGKISFSESEVTGVCLAFGGMAAIPKRAFNTEKLLLEKGVLSATEEEIELSLQQDFTPLSDFRATQLYRNLVSKNLVLRFLIELRAELEENPEKVPLQLLHSGEVRHVG